VENLMRKTLPILLLLLAGATVTSSTIQSSMEAGQRSSVTQGGYGSGFLDGKLILAGGTHWRVTKAVARRSRRYDPKDKWQS